MVEATRPQHSLAHRLLRFFAYIMAGGIIAQIFCCLAAYLLIYDSQAAGMVANLVVQHLAYYFLGCAFGILSVANVLIKRGLTPLRRIRLNINYFKHELSTNTSHGLFTRNSAVRWHASDALPFRKLFPNFECNSTAITHDSNYL